MMTLSARNLNKRFGHITAVRNVSLRILPGRITGFLGPNGAGKTTLFYLLSGDLSPDSGRIILEENGTKVDLAKLRRHRVARSGVGFLYQDIRVFSTLSVLDNVIVALNTPQEDGLCWGFTHLRNMKRIRQQHREQAVEWLKFVGLYAENENSDRLEKKAAELSFGEKKLLCFAQLLSGNFGFLLLDEPMAGLNEYYVHKIESLIKHIIADTDVTVAIIEHDIRVLERLADFLYFMAEGEIVFFGLTGHVLGNEDIRRTYIGMD